jgi:hypothetical protein
MERQSKGSGGFETYCNGGQGPLRAVAPWKKEEEEEEEEDNQFIVKASDVMTVTKKFSKFVFLLTECLENE